jgi:predicted DNA-binding protein
MNDPITKRGRGRPPQAIKRMARRVQPRLAKEVHDRLVEYCTGTGQTQTAVIQAAVQQFVEGVTDHTLLMRRLDRLGRALFLQFWFAHTPTIPEDTRDAARRSSASRYKQFAQHLAEQFGRGRRFIDDLPKELLMEDRELEEIATTGDDAPPVPKRH